MSSRMSLSKRKGTRNDFAISADLTRDLIFRELTTSIPNPPPIFPFPSSLQLQSAYAVSKFPQSIEELHSSSSRDALYINSPKSLQTGCDFRGRNQIYCVGVDRGNFALPSAPLSTRLVCFLSGISHHPNQADNPVSWPHISIIHRFSALQSTIYLSIPL